MPRYYYKAVKLDGEEVEGEYDAVDVAGTLTLGGDLVVTLLGGFSPKAGDVFDLWRRRPGSHAAGLLLDSADLPGLQGRGHDDRRPL